MSLLPRPYLKSIHRLTASTTLTLQVEKCLRVSKVEPISLDGTIKPRNSHLYFQSKNERLGDSVMSMQEQVRLGIDCMGWDGNPVCRRNMVNLFAFGRLNAGLFGTETDCSCRMLVKQHPGHGWPWARRKPSFLASPTCQPARHPTFLYPRA